MHAQVRDGGALRFAQDAALPEAEVRPWKILIADDEEEVHRVTKLALLDFTHGDRPLEFLHAYSGHEAVARIGEHPDIALVLMDVVMESEHAGLHAVSAIRQQLRNRLTRIVIRTGQPGSAPEAQVVRDYDINDYREKTAVTARTLHTLVHNGLNLYRELATLHDHRQGLEHVIGAAATLQAQRSEEGFGRSALQQLAMMLYADAPRMPSDMLLAAQAPDRASRVLAGTGYYAGCAGRRIEEALGPELFLQAEAALGEGPSAAGPLHFIVRAPTSDGGALVAYIAGEGPARAIDATYLGLFCRSLGAGFDNLRLQRELTRSQRSLVLLLATAVEQRAHVHGGHGQRVARTVALLGELLELPAAVREWLPLAATLHDLGQIAIPETILSKRGSLTRDELSLFETHTRWGQDLLTSQDSQVLQMAGVIAGQHHERWDGAGYPAGLSGTRIHLHARITAIADALDEWLDGPARQAPDEALALLQRERGARFDPQLVDLVLQHAERFKAVAVS